MAVHLEIYHNEALCNKGNMAFLKLCQLSSSTSVHRLHNVKTKEIKNSYQQKERFFNLKLKPLYTAL